MTIIQFGNWLPDQARFGNNCVTATNVYPTAKGYGPFADAVAVGDALSANCVGVFSYKTVAGVIETFAGTATKLFRRNGTIWDDASRSGDYQNSTFWRFADYGDRLIATNGRDAPQTINVAAGEGAFSDLANAPSTNFLIVVRDILVALGVTDGSGFEVKWSAVNNSELWTATGGGGSQPLPDGGPLRGGTGGEFGIILQEGGLTRMDFVGGDLRFTFDKIEGSVGCISANSVVKYKGRTFYLSDEGFQTFDGASSINISDEATTDTFFAALSQVETLVTDTDEVIITSTGEAILVRTAEAVEGALDVRNSCVIWRYPTSTASKLIIYNYRFDRWSESDIDVDCLHANFLGGRQILAAIDSDKKLALFNGSDRTATVSTGDLQLTRDRGTRVSSIRGLVDSAFTATVGKKTDMADTEKTKSKASNSNGKASINSDGRLQRLQLVPTAAFTELLGVDVEARPSGRKV